MSIKLSKETAVELLTRLGVEDVELVDNADEADKTVDYDGIVAKLIPEVDPNAQTVDVQKEVDAAIGRQMGSIYSLAAKTFGLKRSEVDSLKPDELLAKLKTTAEGRFTQTESALRQELEEKINSHNEDLEKINADWEVKFSSEREKFIERDIVDYYRKEYSNIPKKGGDLDLLAETALSRARMKYDVKWNEAAKKPEYFEKGIPDKRVLVGKSELDTKTFLTEFNKGLGNEATDTSHIVPSQIRNDPNAPAGIHQQTNGDLEADPHSAAISKLSAQVDEVIAGA
jgi:hypothetical protein